MKRLKLFTAFHANMDFSAMPENDRSRVIASCYWPILSLPEEYGIRIGFEASGRTLEILEREDPEWVKKFRALAERGLVELLGSGWAQVVAPLAPSEINGANLRLGNEVYERIFGSPPETFFVNEQTYSDGLAPLYGAVGAERLVMEWNNPASRRPELRDLRCCPARLRVPGGGGPAVLWNDSIVFQKMQRIAHGEIPFAELDRLLDRLVAIKDARALCIYGGDVEIFDYRPSRPVPKPVGAPGESEIGRLIATFRALAADDRFEFALPREVVDRAETLAEVELGSAAEPIPCKKQPRYNPTRWAVSGRDGFGMNTRCFELLRTERSARRLAGAGAAGNRTAELVDLWRSDFRTRATEEKLVDFETGLGLATARSRALLERCVPALGEGEDILLVNAMDRDWQGLPVEIPVELAAGQAFDLDIDVRGGDPLPPERVQFEVLGRHRDGSIRRANLVVEPDVAARSSLAMALVPRSPREGSLDETPDHEVEALGTEQVEVSFLPHRGAALEALSFPAISDQPLVGTIPHGFFDRIEYTPDFYSGHVVAVTETGVKRTDLSATQLRLEKSLSGSLRMTLVASVDTPLGPWQTIYRLYRNRPRLDVIHDLAFHDARLSSLRLGICTLRPEGWNRSGLRFGTTNGAHKAEWRHLDPGIRIAQSQAVSSTVSASSCLGATEGWVAIEDGERGILIQGDRSEAAVVPMLDFEDVDEGFFCRLSHTAAEMDETRASFLRGRRRFAFSIEGHPGIETEVLANARARHEGLIYRTETGVGLTSAV